MSNLGVSLPINLPLQPQNLVAPALAKMEQGKRVAMLTLVNIEGSAPYPLGSQMLVVEDGERFGQITGGCAESALADQAVQAIMESQSQTHRYGAQSPYFDIQLPCGSGIDVHIDVTTSKDQYQAIVEKLRNRRTAEQAIPITSTVGQPAASQESAPFIQHYRPSTRLLVFGQGPIMVSLIRLGVEAGFEVIALAQDENSAHEIQAAGFNVDTIQSAEQTIQAATDPYCAAVSLFHEHDRETELLAQLLRTEVFYIGALGSRRTHAARLAALKEMGVSEQAASNIIGPVGMDIGAETPSQIAISILAELISLMPKANANQ